MTIRIRKGTIDDAGRMADIFNHYVAGSDVIFSNRQLTAADMAAKMAPVVGRFPFLVAEDDSGRVIGYCYAHLWHPDPVYGRTWELTEYLDSTVTGGGVGSRLIDAVIDECRAAGAHTLIAAVTAGNEPCERMLMRRGFTLAGVIRDAGYKFGRYLGDAFYQLVFD